MENNKNFKTKNVVLLVVMVLIVASFVFLKVKSLTKQDDKVIVDNNLTDMLTNSVFNDKNSGIIGRLSSYQELQSFVKEKMDASNNYRNYGRLAVKSLDSAMPVNESSSETAGSQNVSGSDGVDFSSSNIQVSGVDEADIIKTDGKYIYAVVDRDLYIIKAYPGNESEIIKKISLDSSISNIYIQNNKLLVFGGQSDFYIMDSGVRTFSTGSSGEEIVSSDGLVENDIAVDQVEPSSKIFPGNYSQQVFLKVYDVSDVSNPILERDMLIDGSYFDSRLIGDYLYFIVNNYNYGDVVLPKVRYQNNEFSYDCADQKKSNCLSPDIYYFNTSYDSFNLTSIFSINIADATQDFESSFYLLPSNQNLYVSLNNIYISYTKYLDEYALESKALLEILNSRLSEEDRNTITEINGISDKILSVSEKQYKIRNILNTYVSSLNIEEQKTLNEELKNLINSRHPNLRDELETTIIYKLSIQDGIVEPIIEGSIPGRVLNQFSMDEYNGNLRVATTRSNVWSNYITDTSSHNNVYILNSDLMIVGQSEDLASGENIYSVRFMGDRAYVVTFKQVDPLFILDLSNPYSPKLLGELKISGFSNYLHPFNKNILIGFGKETKEVDSRTLTAGLKMSLFDISGDTPKEIDSYVIGESGSESIALYDHHAFLASENKNIIVVPATVYNDSGNWQEASFNGFLVFELVDNKIKLKGQISHNTDKISGYENFINYSAKRALYIEDNLYSFSNQAIKINALKDLAEVKTVNLN